MSAHLKSPQVGRHTSAALSQGMGRHSVQPALGRHLAPMSHHNAGPSRGQRAAVACGIGLVTFAVASPAMRALGGEVSAPVPGAAAHASAGAVGGTWSTALCERAVTSLLSDDLVKVSTGRPDLGPSSYSDVAAELGGTATVSMARVQQVHDDLVGDATSELISSYHPHVPAVLHAVAPKIAASCVAVAAS